MYPGTERVVEGYLQIRGERGAPGDKKVKTALAMGPMDLPGSVMPSPSSAV